MRLIFALVTAVTVAACAGPTAQTSDKDVCLGMVKSRSVTEMMSYEKAAVKRGLTCEDMDASQITEKDLESMVKNMNTLIQQNQHLLK